MLVHNVCTTAADIEFEKLHSLKLELATHYCFCPNANLYITNTLPDVNLFIQQAVILFWEQIVLHPITS